MKKIRNTIKDLKHYKLKALMAAVVIMNGIILSSCETMEDTYKEYVITRVYSPKVLNLTAVVGYKTVTLNWDNPKGDIAKKIHITYGDVTVTLEEMVETVTIDELEIIGYDFSVYTVDAQGNLSVPASIYVFPNGE
jgi:hypothetical protein